MKYCLNQLNILYDQLMPAFYLRCIIVIHYIMIRNNLSEDGPHKSRWLSKKAWYIFFVCRIYTHLMNKTVIKPIYTSILYCSP